MPGSAPRVRSPTLCFQPPASANMQARARRLNPGSTGGSSKTHGGSERFDARVGLKSPYSTLISPSSFVRANVCRCTALGCDAQGCRALVVWPKVEGGQRTETERAHLRPVYGMSVLALTKAALARVAYGLFAGYLASWDVCAR